MPELPEVEVLKRYLAPLLKGKKVVSVEVRRDQVLAPTNRDALAQALTGAWFSHLERRGKYLLFEFRKNRKAVPVLGHLGMTGRMYLQSEKAPLAKHAAVILHLGACRFVYEDPRYFGRFTLDVSPVESLGPEPLSKDFTSAGFAEKLRRSAQAIKVRLLDQSLVAGIGNIYASEALYRARLSPRRAARRLTRVEIQRLWKCARAVLSEAIHWGSTIPLGFDGSGQADGLFYFGTAGDAPQYYHERLRVYDRAGQSCKCCGGKIKRIIQSARSTYYCPKCQK